MRHAAAEGLSFVPRCRATSIISFSCGGGGPGRSTCRKTHAFVFCRQSEAPHPPVYSFSKQQILPGASVGFRLYHMKLLKLHYAVELYDGPLLRVGLLEVSECSSRSCFSPFLGIYCGKPTHYGKEEVWNGIQERVENAMYGTVDCLERALSNCAFLS